MQGTYISFFERKPLFSRVSGSVPFIKVKVYVTSFSNVYVTSFSNVVTSFSNVVTSFSNNARFAWNIIYTSSADFHACYASSFDLLFISMLQVSHGRPKVENVKAEILVY